jgi:hypothetical protein
MIITILLLPLGHISFSHPMVWLAPTPLRLIFGFHESSVKIGGSAFVSSNSENISGVTFLKHKYSRKQGIGTVTSH